MANNDLGGVWRTIGGRRVFIKDGVDLATAMKDSGKFKITNKTKVMDSLDKQIDYIKEHEKELLDVMGKSENSEEEAKRICEVLQEHQGFNEKPVLMDEKEFDSLDEKEYIKLYRGIADGEKTADDYIEQFKNGKNEYGTGLNSYGVGHYTTTDEDMAKSYGKVMEMKLPKNAKIGFINMSDYEEGDMMERAGNNFRPYISDMEGYYNKYGDNITTILDSLERETSAYAIMSGYDAIKIIDKLNGGKDIYVILNRGKVVVKK